MSRPEDALELLLPDADPESVRRARDVTRFLRLLSDDAQPARAGAVGVDLESARHELERADRADLECALVDLLRHYLAAACTEDSFAWFGEPVLDVRAAWRVLGEFEVEHEWIASVPLPGETTDSVAERLIQCLVRLGANAFVIALWRARCAHVFDGPLAALRLYRDELRDAPARAALPAHVRQLTAGVAECLLERGAVREARALLFEHVARHGPDARLRQLLSWSRLALNDAVGARAALVGLRPWHGTIPAGLAQLRTLRPEWLSCLAGRVPASRAPLERETVRDRHELGASVLAAFTYRNGVGARAIHVDVAPGLRDSVRAWAEQREDAHESAGSLEQRVITEGRTVVEHATGELSLRHAVGGNAARAIALTPVLDDEGEVAGWVYIECEHHLLPGATRLASLALGWRSIVLPARERNDDAASADSDSRPMAAAPAESAFARVFEELVAAIGIKLYQRRWCGFTLVDGEPECVARGGEGVGFEGDRPGRARALARAVATGGQVAFDAPDERLSIHAQAASGFVVALSVAGAPCGFLAVESSRRRDFKPKDIETCARKASEFGLALRIAEFVEWHRRRFQFEPRFDARRADFRSFAAHSIAAARSRSAVVLAGEPGVGKLVLARWIHFESGRRDAPFKVHTCGLEGDAQAGSNALFASARDGTLVLDDVERLAPARQEELLRVLERVERAIDGSRPMEPTARILATTTSSLDATRKSGLLRADLAARLDRLTLLVPPLRERREEIPALARALAERFALEEDCAPPHWSDEVLALLWRQPWNENLRGLENVVYKLVLLYGGEALQPEHLAQLARHFGLDLVRKLPSRHPRRRDLVAALRTTLTTGGRVNKTRAALYLGWDPDTLVARMASEHVSEESLQAEDAWQIHSAVVSPERVVDASDAAESVDPAIEGSAP